jgi:3-oxoacyl-[acyl-carrier protein] reductase
MMGEAGSVVISGGAGHLGRAVARWWAKPGIDLFLIDRDAVKLKGAGEELAATGAAVTPLAVDVTAPDELAKAVASLPASLSATPLSLVLAHALSGKDARGKSPRLGELEGQSFREVLDANLISVVFAIQTFLPFMRRAGGGRIVLVSSTAGLSASPTAALSYSLSKAGVAALPRLLAPELAASGVLINAVAPGKFANPDWPDDPAKVERYEKSVPLGRLASADEVAALIGFLGSGANTYVTGQTILQDGGRLSALPIAEQG